MKTTGPQAPRPCTQATKPWSWPASWRPRRTSAATTRRTTAPARTRRAVDGRGVAAAEPAGVMDAAGVVAGTGVEDTGAAEAGVDAAGAIAGLAASRPPTS